MNERGRPKLVVVVGTNASGKSDLGVELAKEFGGEIVSADSRQVYRGLDIGTGKLDPNEMQGIPHHLIDVADVTDMRVRAFSLAQYQSLAYDAIDGILRRRRLPVLVGGTGLYVRAIVEGYQLAEAPPDYNRRIQLESLGADELHDTLQQLDASAAAMIDPRNRRRMIRAIEIAERGGSYATRSVNIPRYHALQLGVTWPSEILRTRIDARLRRRLDEGMIEEAASLMKQGVTVEAMYSLGLEYRHLAKLLSGEYHDRRELFDKLRTAIFRFSRRQMSWFRKEESVFWLDTSGDYLSEARALVADFLSSDGSMSS